MVRTVSMNEARTHLPRLLNDVARGDEVIIARNGKPVARLVSLAAPTAPRRPGQWRGQVEVASDFDAPLPEALAAAFRGAT